MKMMYITPKITTIDLKDDVLIANSPGGLENGNSIGNQKPTGDDDGNIFVKQQSQWDKEW